MDNQKEAELKDYRCPVCNKLFFRGKIIEARIEVKCRNCKLIAIIK